VCVCVCVCVFVCVCVCVCDPVCLLSQFPSSGMFADINDAGAKAISDGFPDWNKGDNKVGRVELQVLFLCYRGAGNDETSEPQPRRPGHGAQ
jgi:hypothetical protein